MSWHHTMQWNERCRFGWFLIKLCYNCWEVHGISCTEICANGHNGNATEILPLHYRSNQAVCVRFVMVMPKGKGWDASEAQHSGGGASRVWVSILIESTSMESVLKWKLFEWVFMLCFSLFFLAAGSRGDGILGATHRLLSAPYCGSNICSPCLTLHVNWTYIFGLRVLQKTVAWCLLVRVFLPLLLLLLLLFFRFVLWCGSSFHGVTWRESHDFVANYSNL